MTTTSTVPTADRVEPATLPADPDPACRRLLDTAPVAWVSPLGRYLVTSGAACRAAQEDRESYSANVSGAATPARALEAPTILRKDDPGHAGERRAIDALLWPKTLRVQWIRWSRAMHERNRTSRSAACTCVPGTGPPASR